MASLPLQERVLIVAPLGRDAAAMAEVLSREGLAAQVCAGLGECCDETARGAGALLMTEEALDTPGSRALLDSLVAQPAWSDLPLVVLAGAGETRQLGLLRTAGIASGRVTLLERPLHAATLVSTLQVALRSRRRQYQVRDLLEEQQRHLAERQAAQGALQRHVARQAALLELSQLMLSSNRVDPGLMHKVFDHVERTLGSDVGFHYALDPVEGGLKLHAAHGVPEPALGRVQRLRLGEAFCGRVAAQGRPLLADAARIDADPDGALVRAMGVRAYFCQPLHAADGRLLGTLSWGSTRRTSFEPVEREFLETLSGLVALAWERSQVEQALKEAHRRKDEFLAMLAHELRNPLAPVRNAAALLRRADGLRPHGQQAVLMIERQMRHMTHLIDDLLDVARITSGKLELHRRPLQLEEVVGRAAESVRPLLAPRGQELDVRLPSDPAWIDGDETRLTQVLVNLLTNAAKYSEDGGRIELSASAGGDGVRIAVRDQGIGIAPELLPHVFDLFRQAERTLDRAQGGLGVGLTVVKGLVEMHGGSVSASSGGPGQGSEFLVRLPRARPPHLDAAESPAAAGPPRPARILVVDDNQDAAESLSLLLKMEGHLVHVANHGAAALEEAARLAPEICLLDLGLPGMDGYELARRLREIEATRDAVLIAVTGYGQAEDRRRTRAAGFDHHLVKPVDPDDASRLIASLVAPAAPPGQGAPERRAS